MPPAAAQIVVSVTATNPGQFFACCGLLELADRLWNGAEGWFGERDHRFCIQPLESGRVIALRSLIAAVTAAPIGQVDRDDRFSSPLLLGWPFNLRLDWWKDLRSGGRALKVWAGSMSGVRIAEAMQNALPAAGAAAGALLDHAAVVRDPADQRKKVEPFYFDARRGAAARSLDIGFAPDSLNMHSVASPATEFLALVGLQRFRPSPAGEGRTFTYSSWDEPLSPAAASLAASGHSVGCGGQRYRFEVVYRTDQKKHKAFGVASTSRSGQ